MSTSAITYVVEDDQQTPLFAFYRQSDGYIEGHGQDLIDFLKTRKITCGIPMDPAPEGMQWSNGAGDLAAQLLCHFKNQSPVGGIYVTSFDDNAGADHTYWVRVDTERGSILLHESTNAWSALYHSIADD